MTKKQTLNKSERNERILLDIVEQYIQTAEPVSSSQLLATYKYDLSSATLRNIMATLDEAGYLIQPHTSAGRIPTAKAYRFYVDKVRLGTQRPPRKKKTEQGMSENFQKDLRRTMGVSLDEAARMLSQQLAELSHSMAFAGLLEVNHFYREGLAHLLDEPEFLNAQNIRNLIEYADSLENRLEKLCANIQDEICVFIGEERQTMRNAPLSLMAFTQKLPNHQQAVFGIVGPMRMQYSRNLELLNEVRDLFK